MHKIFNNLVIISNNVKPEEFEYIIDGDAYSFDKNSILGNNAEIIKSPDYPNKTAIKITQKCRDIRNDGRRLGNTQYREDS